MLATVSAGTRWGGLARPLAALFVALLVSGVSRAGEVSVEKLESPEGFDVQGHRGCRGLLPENSMAAFRRALDLGITTLELDLQRTADGVLVVYHDASLDSKRCIRDDGSRAPGKRFSELRWSDLADVDCGTRRSSGFPDQELRSGTRIPRIEEVLELARDASYPVRLSIEIKLQSSRNAGADAFVEVLVPLVREHDLVERTTIQSFDPEALRNVEKAEAALRTAILVRNRSKYERLLAECACDVLSPRFGQLRSTDVTQFRRRGLGVIPWTVNDRDSIRRMILWGVDGVISDYPDRVLEVLEELKSPSP